MVTASTDFCEFYNNSYYTIVGAGLGEDGTHKEWEEGYNDLLQKECIGIPKAWFSFTGKEISDHFNLQGDKRFQDDLHFLCFPLDGLNVRKLAIFRLRMGDSWMDDLIQNSI